MQTGPSAPPSLGRFTEAEGGASGSRPHLIEATLQNGLKILMIQDRSAPLVSFQVWFDVGSVHEHEAAPGEDHGITGLSHFFEHMMFRGTKRFPRFFDTIYGLGGRLNAFTWLDETVYWENVPSQHLRTVIDMEADRLENMTIDFLNLEPEREVVKSERLLRTENRAEGLAGEVLRARVFESFPYHWGTIGWMRDLNAVTVAEAQAYHGVFYAPNNATVIVVGDHDPAQTLAWIREAYGHLPSKELPSEQFEPEPRQVAERRDRVFKPADPQVVLWAYRAPAVREQDFVVLEVLDRILVGGKSGRLQKSLVYADVPRLGSLSTQLYPLRHPHMYRWTAYLQPGMTVHELEDAVDAEVGRVVADGVDAEELARAVAGLRADVVQQNLSNQRKGEFIGFSLRATDDPMTFLDRLSEYGEVTAKEVRRVAKEVLRPDNRTWVPVVNRQRLVDLQSFYRVASPGFPAPLADVTRGATRMLIRRVELREKAARLDVEEEAIGLLAKRAKVHRDRGSAEIRAAIDAYLTDNEKGTVKRQGRLEAERGQLHLDNKALEEEAIELRRKLREVLKMRWDPGHAPHAYALNLAENIVQPWRSSRFEPLGARYRHIDPSHLAHRVAYEASIAWVLEFLGKMAAAQTHRERALALAEPVLAKAGDDGPGRLLARAYALAWDCQIVGRALVDAPDDGGGVR